MRRRLVLGPPGTGKTSTLLETIENELRSGTEPQDLAFVSFTRSAIREARSRAVTRCRCRESDLGWFRTLHSAFARVQGLTECWLERKHWRSFSRRYGYDLSVDRRSDLHEGYLAPPPLERPDDILRAAHEWGRARLLSLDRTAARYPGFVDLIQLREYAARLDRYKADSKRLDYTDVLERAIEAEAVLPVESLIVDEAQDLSPLQIRAIQPTIDAVTRVTVAGDDDQAIYAYQGADPAWLLGLAKTHETTVLDRSWRVPRAVHRVAEGVVRRNQGRVRKDYRPRDAEGSVAVCSVKQAVQDAQEAGRVFVLSRTRKSSQRLAWALHDALLPYRVERGAGPDPYGQADAPGLKAADQLARGEPVPAEGLRVMAKRVGSLTRTERKQLASLRGTVSPLEIHSLGLGPLQKEIRDRGLQTLDLASPQTTEWFDAVRRKHGKIPEPRIRVATIHAAKGREADLVILVPDHPAVVERARVEVEGYEAENRIAYVAATRARSDLRIVVPDGRFWYDYPSA
jgi:DNA helicase-2/ATP-dependent DNA helicase PcrA